MKIYRTTLENACEISRNKAIQMGCNSETVYWWPITEIGDGMAILTVDDDTILDLEEYTEQI